MAQVKMVGVVGAGQMGAGIAQLVAAANLQVLMSDVDSVALARGMRTIASSLARFVKKGTLAQVIGMHFMNPPPLMQLVEIVRGPATADEVFGTIKNLAERLGKTVTCSRDFPGFIVNRILMPMINEAFYALMEGIGSPQDIDVGMKLGTNQPMGPLTLADFIGLDTCLSIMNVLHKGLGDSKYRPCPLLIQYVDAGWHGRKSGRGVYSYNSSLAWLYDWDVKIFALHRLYHGVKAPIFIILKDANTTIMGIFL
ncbi:hypothetical protein O6H91_11G022000 [Diphasiastrum complanatum]|uniref:Uncharacterized protein n=1 Tax=Diphasiastrum complanatum TaxID=34168 RepID=A0ACC2C6X1_DIPCM|nr:hypothetical protein O6H91_11G022000 [Diphasiastrum complanatum]